MEKNKVENEEDLSGRIEQFLESAKSIKNEFKKIHHEVFDKLKKCDLLLLQLKKDVKAHERILLEIYKVNQNVDESLGNVLLAIRQNEYLQAWHPPQHGFPAMKVTGKHPAKNQPLATLPKKIGK